MVLLRVLICQRIALAKGAQDCYASDLTQLFDKNPFGMRGFLNVTLYLRESNLTVHLCIEPFVLSFID